MTVNARDVLVLVKVETTNGTDASCDAADAIELIAEPELSPEFEMIEQQAVNGSLADLLPLVGKKSISMTLKGNLKGSGTAATATKWSRLLQAAGFTATATTDVDYTPEPEYKTVSVYVYRGGHLHKLLGGASSFSIAREGAWTWSATVQGKYGGTTATAAPASPVFDSGARYNGLAPSFTYDSHAAILREFSFDVGAQIAECSNINDATGIDHFIVTGHKPTGSMTVEDEALGTWDWRGKAEANDDPGAIAFSFGSGAGNQIAFSAPNCRLGSPSESSEGGIAVLQFQVFAADSTAGGKDFLTLTSS